LGSFEFEIFRDSVTSRVGSRDVIGIYEGTRIPLYPEKNVHETPLLTRSWSTL